MQGKYIVALDQGTTSSRTVVLDQDVNIVAVVQREFPQIYPRPGWVEHDPRQIWATQSSTLTEALASVGISSDEVAAIGITNQRETTVVWEKDTGKPVYNAIVWQCRRTAQICDELRKNEGFEEYVRENTGLLLDPYFSGTKIKWILDNVPGAREKAEKGQLLFGTIDTWLIWNMTQGRVHVTDYTNASRTLLFNIHTLDWDDELLRLFTIPRSMMAEPHPCDSVFGETTVEGIFSSPITIAGVLGDSHGALAGQMCFEPGMGKATYGTGSSVMVNIGEEAIGAPEGLVTSVGFAACGKVFYAFEGNIHCTGATIKWMADQLRLIESPAAIEALAAGVPDNGGVYLVPAFAGLGAPWWNPHAKAMICGMTLGTERGHVCRAALEAIAYQIKDLIDLMTCHAGITLKELRVDGGPTKNKLLMQFQADMLNACINRSDVEEASAMGAVVMNGLARGVWKDLDEVAALRTTDNRILPQMADDERARLYAGWVDAVRTVNKQ